MPRAVWSGSISFGLVNVPVKAFTAVRAHDVHFHQLEKGTGARIRNQRISEKTGKPVDSDDIEMGFEIRKGRHITFEKDEIEELKPESTRAIEVSDFVALEDIDPIYYERTYWLAPADKAATEPYRLLLAAMEARSRVGIGTVVMRNKQYLTAIRPLDGALAMSTMRFADEVVPRADIDELPSGRSKPEAKALKLAEQIVDSLTSDWDPEQYHDTFTDELKAAIEQKDKRGKDDVVESDGDEGGDEEAEVLDLMAALERSVSEAKAKRGGGSTRPSSRSGSRSSSRSSSGSGSAAKKAGGKAKTATRKRAPAKKAAAKKSA